MKKQRAPRLLSLCTGIGGIDLAWEMAGGVVAGQCEIDPFCQQVLVKHWPDVKRVADIRNVWGDSFDGPIDLVAGGIPCQPWSVAGLRRGHADDRHLWPAMRRIIEIYQPAWVLVENVSGFIGMALDGVCADLEATGYEVGTLVLPAAAVGAPHQRERVFIVAHTSRHLRRSSWHEGYATSDGSGADGVAYTSCAEGGRLQQRGLSANTQSGSDDVANAYQYSGRRAQRAERGDVDGATGADATREGHLQRHPDQRSGEDVEHTSSSGQQERHPSRIAGDAGHASGRSDAQRCDGQTQSYLGGVADGTARGLDGTARADRDDASDSYPYQPWPAGPGQAQYDWEAPRTTQERIPQRAARLKALGNAVVPQQVYPILVAIIEQWRQEEPQVQDEIEVTA